MRGAGHGVRYLDSRGDWRATFPAALPTAAASPSSAALVSAAVTSVAIDPAAVFSKPEQRDRELPQHLGYWQAAIEQQGIG